MKTQKSIRIFYGKRRLAAFAAAISLLLSAVTLFSLPVGAEDMLPLVSPGLSVLAEQSSMAMAGLRGGSISFERADFARALNLPLSSITDVTFTSVPSVSEGELLVGTTVLNSGQTVSGTNLHLLSYEPKEEISCSSFSFRVGSSPVEMTCKLYMLDEVNYCPSLNVASSFNSFSASTYGNTTLFGVLPAYDPEGDEITIEIVSYPSGILELTDKHTGEYTYTPLKNASGKDSFTYVARDVYGNYSASATVNLTVKRSTVSVTYADMKNSPYANAAMAMTERGIMSGSQVGAVNYFYPNVEVSRAEFVVLAMNALGVTSVSNTECKVFADGKDIPEQMRGYIEAAYRMGYVKGSLVDGELCFRPNETITRAEASAILGNMLGAAMPTATVKPSFADSEEIPTWAEGSVYSLNMMGLLTASDGKIEPLSKVTRQEAAQLLSGVGVR